MVSAGRALTRKGGYGAFLGVAVSDRAELLAAARAEIGRGAATLKVIVSGVVDFVSGTVGLPHFDRDDLRELVALARHAGVPVAAHANGAEAIGIAVAAGVDSVEHGILISEAELVAMAAAGTRWVPTLTPLHNLRGDPRWPRLAEIFGRHLEAVARGRELGVILVAGSDAGSPGVPHGSLHTEITLLRRAGLSPPELRRAATSAAAELLGLGDGYGRLEVGACTDLAWFAEDPVPGNTRRRAGRTGDHDRDRMRWLRRPGLTTRPPQVAPTDTFRYAAGLRVCSGDGAFRGRRGKSV